MLRLNVGGKFFITSRESVCSCGPNFFTNFLDKHKNVNCIFIDRDPKMFDLVLNHLRGYTIVLPYDDRDLRMLYDDSVFYGVQSLVNQLSRVLQFHIDVKERKQLIETIKLLTETYQIEWIRDSVSKLEFFPDSRLIEIKNRIDKELWFRKILQNLQLIINLLLNITGDKLASELMNVVVTENKSENTPKSSTPESTPESSTQGSSTQGPSIPVSISEQSIKFSSPITSPITPTNNIIVSDMMQKLINMVGIELNKNGEIPFKSGRIYNQKFECNERDDERQRLQHV